jgi:carbonic anhydrase
VTLEAELLAANRRYAEGFTAGRLARSPGRKLAVVTCMDARIDPLAALGLALGDAIVLRNAGGIVTEDVLRSLAVAHAVLGVRAAAVVGHTECGLERARNEAVRAALGAGDLELDVMPFSDVEERVRASVRAVRGSAVLGGRLEALGYVYDVRSGRLRPVDG